MLEAFVAGLTLITVSELGDKTFFIAVLLATRHARWLVFLGVIAALATMTVLSVAVGQLVSFLPATYIRQAEVALFLGFGFKLLYDASQMSSQPCCPDAEKEAVQAVKVCDEKLSTQPNNFAVLSQAFVLTFIAEWGDRTQIATIGLAAAKNVFGVTAGAILGHAICTAIAVVSGKMIAGKISERTLTAIGGGLFLVFGGLTAMHLMR